MFVARISVAVVVNEVPIKNIGGVPATWEATGMTTPKDLRAKGSPFAASAALASKKAAGKVPITKQEQATSKHDRFAVLRETGPTSVGLELEEKVSGPPGTYSSVTVRVSITARCEQSSAAVEQAHDLLFTECTAAIDRYMRPAVEQLEYFLERRGG